MSMFLNSKESANYVASVEMQESSLRNPTRIVSEIKKCRVVNNTLKIKSIYRMPQFVGVTGNGDIVTSAPIFDTQEKQEIQLNKNQSGKIVSTVFKTKLTGTQTCNF